jgi:hypothetical protein
MDWASSASMVDDWPFSSASMRVLLPEAAALNPSDTSA